MKREKFLGFTLAEVLITLGTIGIIAALTLPPVINMNKERVTVNKVKKIYSTLSQAFLLSVKDNGYPKEWTVGDRINQTTAVRITSYFKPYLKIIKDCGTNSGCLKYTQNHFLLNGRMHDKNYDTSNYYYKMILIDGSYIWFRGPNSGYCTTSVDGQTNVCGMIFYDINGGKKPNTIGKDIFEFIVTVNGVLPAIIEDCNMTSDGWGCSGYILKNNNMNYLKQ